MWRLSDAEEAFDGFADAIASPYDDLVLEYRDPATNGPVMPTMSASIQRLRAGVRTEPHQHTSSCVYHVVRGAGASMIGGERFAWQQGDTFALPTWAVHSHENSSSEDALLFSFSDEPALASLGLLREQAT